MHTLYVPHTFTRSAVAKKKAGARSSKVKNTTCMVPAVLASTALAYGSPTGFQPLDFRLMRAVLRYTRKRDSFCSLFFLYSTRRVCERRTAFDRNLHAACSSSGLQTAAKQTLIWKRLTQFQFSCSKLVIAESKIVTYRSIRLFSIYRIVWMRLMITL